MGWFINNFQNYKMYQNEKIEAINTLYTELTYFNNCLKDILKNIE